MELGGDAEGRTRLRLLFLAVSVSRAQRGNPPGLELAGKAPVECHTVHSGAGVFPIEGMQHRTTWPWSLVMVLGVGGAPRPTRALRSRTGARSGLQGDRELGGRWAAGPGFAPGSPSSCCPGSQWRGRWTSAGGSGLGTALSSRPPARCTWLRESRRGSVTPGPGEPTPGSHFTPRPDAALSLGTCRIPSREGALATTPAALGPHSQLSSLAHFLLQNLQNIFFFF